MAENKKQNLPSFASLDELTDFFDANDMGDYSEAMPEVDFNVNLQRKTHLVAIDEETNDKLKKIAKQQRIPTETLIKAWIKEKISSY